MFNDSDSLFYEVVAKDVYKDFREDKMFWSKYISKRLSILWSMKQAIEMYKDKASCKTITEFVGLKYEV